MAASGPNSKADRVRGEVVQTEDTLHRSLVEFSRAGEVVRAFEGTDQGKALGASEREALEMLKQLINSSDGIAASSAKLHEELAKQHDGGAYSGEAMLAYQSHLELLVKHIVLYERFNAQVKKGLISNETLKTLDAMFAPPDNPAQSFQFYLIQPLQRIMRYILLFNDLNKSLLENDPAKGNVIAFINEATRQSDVANKSVTYDQELRALVDNSKNVRDPKKWGAFFSEVESHLNAGKEIQIDISLINRVLAEQCQKDKKFLKAYRNGTDTAKHGRDALQFRFDALIRRVIDTNPLQEARVEAPAFSPASSSSSASSPIASDVESGSSLGRERSASSSSSSSTTSSVSFPELEQEAFSLDDDSPDSLSEEHESEPDEPVQQTGWGRRQPTSENRSGNVIGERKVQAPFPPPPADAAPPIPPRRARPAGMHFQAGNFTENLKKVQNSGVNPDMPPTRKPPVPPLPPIASSSSPSSPSSPSSSSSGWKPAEKKERGGDDTKPGFSSRGPKPGGR